MYNLDLAVTLLQIGTAVLKISCAVILAVYFFKKF